MPASCGVPRRTISHVKSSEAPYPLAACYSDESHEELVLDEREIADGLEIEPVVVAERHRTIPVSSPCGAFESKRMAPPMLFLPNRVPCGPRNTSTRSRSMRSMSEPVIVLW